MKIVKIPVTVGFDHNRVVGELKVDIDSFNPWIHDFSYSFLKKDAENVLVEVSIVPNVSLGLLREALLAIEGASMSKRLHSDSVLAGKIREFLRTQEEPRA